jgi:hypothetical protein
MRDDWQGRMFKAPAQTVAHGFESLRIAGIAKSEADNLIVSDEPDTSTPSHADIEPLDRPKEPRCPVKSPIGGTLLVGA